MQQSWAGQSKLHSENKATAAQRYNKKILTKFSTGRNFTTSTGLDGVKMY